MPRGPQPIEPKGVAITGNEWIELAKSLGLPPKQTEVGYGIVCGLCDKEIAQLVQIGVPTVRTHLARLFTKMGVDSRTGLVLALLAELRSMNDKAEETSE